MVKRSSRTSKASTPVKVSKTSALSTPSKTAKDAAVSTPVKALKTSAHSTPPKAVKDAAWVLKDEEHVTPQRAPKTSPKQDSKAGDTYGVLIKPSEHKEDTAKSKHVSEVLQSASDALAPLVSAVSGLDAVLEKQTDESDVSEDDDWTSEFKKRERSAPTTSTRDPNPEDFYGDLKKIRVSSRYLRTPAALTLAEGVTLDGIGGTYGTYKMKFQTSELHGEEPWKVAFSIGKAQHKILKNLAERRKITDKDRRREFAQACQSRAVDYDVDRNGGVITLIARYRNISRKDLTVFVRASPGSNHWILPKFKITKLHAGDKIFLVGMIRGYDQQGRHGTSFYLGSKIFLERRNLE